ncbi:hypothetical protein IVB43_23905 [Bradyrhizobium sp. 48]|uniref:hypothetical protein n=1 Tax=Bradyrhizobium sp. 48 TaxID=2782676 RepID=UPI001FFA93D8|nr:hypothetical protein [Bradyrhizobium sp. 48]MCK1445434.1 hypothetical protein [Bradyrhizobium sp. 48]
MKSWLRAVAFLFALLAVQAHAAGIPSASPAPSNIYSLDYTTAIQPTYETLAGKVSVSCALTPGQTTLVLLIVGQSITADSAPTPYTPTNATAHQLNISDGNCYKAIDPLLNTTGQPPDGMTWGGSYPSRLADNIITHAKFQRVIIVYADIGGTSVNDWSPLGPWSGRLRVALLRIRSMGWVGSANVTFRAIYDQGQGDVALGTSQAAWQASFQQVKATINAFGLGSPKICMPNDTLFSGVQSPTIRAAQQASWDNVQVFSGGDFDTLTGTNRQADGTHPSDLGAANMAAKIEPCVAP